MLDHLIRTVLPELSGDRVMADIRELHARDRWFTFPKFHESAQYARGQLAAAGTADAEIIEFPADGRTLCGAWRAPLAWDAAAATLTVLAPAELAGTTLADYARTPCSLAMWSGPTPPGGIEAEVVAVGAGNRPQDYEGRDVRGRIAMTSLRCSAAKGLAAARGAVGVLSDWNPHPAALPDAVFWNNAFSDYESGWPATATCSRIFGFGVSPAVGKRLRQAMGDGKPLRVRAVVDTKLYEGTYPVATGSIRGSGPQEVLALGHAFEQGAKDNASGIACIIESVRVIAALVESGKLARPRRSIRALVTNECFGTISYAARFRDRMRETVGGICLDEVGLDQLYFPEVQSLSRNPRSNASCLDALSVELARALWDGPAVNPWVARPYASTDNIIAHTSIGVPTIWMGCHGPRYTWHTTIDTPDRMSPVQLAAASAYTATYLYFLASAGPRQAACLAHMAAAAGTGEMRQEHVAAVGRLAAAPARQRAAIVEAFARRMAFLALVHEKAVRGAMRLSAAAGVKTAVASGVKAVAACAAELLASLQSGRRSRVRLGRQIVSPFDTALPAEAKKARLSPACLGPITYDPISPADREGHADPRWDGPANIALGWCDGRRTLAEAVALAEHEIGRAQAGLAEEMLWLVGHGLVAGN